MAPRRPRSELGGSGGGGGGIGGGLLPGYLASTASSRTRTDDRSGSSGGGGMAAGSHPSTSDGDDASCAVSEESGPCDSTPRTNTAKLLKRKDSFLAKMSGSVPRHCAGGTCTTNRSSGSGSGSGSGRGGASITKSSGKTMCRQRTQQASAGIRRRWQQRGTNSAKKNGMPPLKTPPRPPGSQVGPQPPQHQQPQQPQPKPRRARSPVSPALTASTARCFYGDDEDEYVDDDLSTIMTASDLSLSLSTSLSMSMASPDRSSPDRSLPSSPTTPPAPSSASVSSNHRRIERAATALDAAGHRHLEEGRVADALGSYRRALKLKRRLLNEGGGGGGVAGGDRDRDGTLPIARGEEAMLGTGTAAAAAAAASYASLGKDRNDEDDDQAAQAQAGGDGSGTGGGAAGRNDPHREALLASVATSVNNVCYARQRMGLAGPDEALHAYQSSLDMKRRVQVRTAGTIGGKGGNDDGQVLVASDNQSHGDTTRGDDDKQKTKTNTYTANNNLTDQQQHDLSVAKTLNNIGTVHLSTAAYPSALASFRESCHLMLTILGPDHVDVSTVHSNAADALLGMKRYGEATEEYGRALKIRAGRSGMDHRKSQRLLGKIRVAAHAAQSAQTREAEEKAVAMTTEVDKEHDRTQDMARGSDVINSPKSPALSVETLQRWFGETDVRDFCLLTDQCESDEDDDDLFGDLKSQLENDLDRITNIGHDLEEEIMKEQAAFMEEVRKMDDSTDAAAAANDTEESTNEGRTITSARVSGEAPRRIQSAADANDAVREVRERLARVRARRNGLDALRRVPVGEALGNGIK